MITEAITFDEAFRRAVYTVSDGRITSVKSTNTLEDLGLDSISVTELLLILEQSLDTSFDDATLEGLMEASNIGEFAAALKASFEGAGT